MAIFNRKYQASTSPTLQGRSLFNKSNVLITPPPQIRRARPQCSNPAKIARLGYPNPRSGFLVPDQKGHFLASSATMRTQPGWAGSAAFIAACLLTIGMASSTPYSTAPAPTTTPPPEQPQTTPGGSSAPAFQRKSVGACNRGTVAYDNETSPFVTSSLNFEPILAGSRTEVALTFTITHELCRGDKILVKLPGFILDPPPGSDVDHELLATTPLQYSKYIAEWQADQTTLIFTYTDFYPIAGNFSHMFANEQRE